MISKKLLISILSIAVSLVVAICLVLTLTLSGNDEELKINQSQIKIEYGGTFDLNKISQKYEKYSFAIEDTSVAKIENGKIVTVSFGKTKLFVKNKNSVNKEIELYIYADSANFDKSSIIIHTSGADTSADFCLYVNNVPYTNATYTFDENIISGENNRVLAKTAGKTQILTTILGNFSNITATIDVLVKDYVYVENIFDDKINLNINDQISKQFLQYENKSGDKIDAHISYDSDYLSYDNGTLTALKVGTTEIEISTLARDGSTLTKTIPVEISPILDVCEYSFYKSNNKIFTLHYSTKADGSLENYVLKIKFNKPIVGTPSFSGINIVETKTSDNQNFEISFTKENDTNINVSAIDPNTNATKSFSLEIFLVQFIQSIEYALIDNTETARECLYIFNDSYTTEANKDGYYNKLRIKTNDNVTVSTTSSLIELVDGFVLAKSCGKAQIKLTATDGSDFVRNEYIHINKVVPTEINFATAPEKLFLYDKISLAPTYSPIYALTDFSITFDDNQPTSQYFIQDDNFNFQATECGDCCIKISENTSTISHMYHFTVLQEFIFMHNYIKYDGSETLKMDTELSSIEILKYTLKNGEIEEVTKLGNVFIKIFDTSNKLVYSSENAESVDTDSPIISNENVLYFSPLTSGILTLQILKGNNIVATLTIEICN